MSVANLNSTGTLRCQKLVLDGQIIVPGAITTTVLTGDAAGSAGASGAVAVSSAVTNTAAATSLEFASTANSLTLTGNISSAGGGGGTTVPTLWSATAAYAVGDVVNVGFLAFPTGTFICITAVAAGSVGSPNPSPLVTPTDWTPVAPREGVSNLITTPATSATGTGAVAFTVGAITTTSAATTLAFDATANQMSLAGNIQVTGGGGGGISQLTTTPATAGTGAGADVAFTVGAITTTSAATSLAFTGSAGAMSLGGNIQVTGAGGLPSIFHTEDKTWAVAGATDTITLAAALPAGTYLPLVSWTTANAALIVGALSAVAPAAGQGAAGSPLQILCSGAVVTTAGSTYSYTLLKLT